MAKRSDWPRGSKQRPLCVSAADISMCPIQVSAWFAWWRGARLCVRSIHYCFGDKLPRRALSAQLILSFLAPLARRARPSRLPVEVARATGRWWRTASATESTRTTKSLDGLLGRD